MILILHDLSFLDPGQPWPPTDSEKRLALYRENHGLYEGKFHEVWPDLAKYLRKGEITGDIGFCLDYPNLITTKTTDLIIGNPPGFDLPVEKGQSENPAEVVLTDLATRLDYLETIDCLIANLDSLGDAVLKLSTDSDGLAHIQNVAPCHWFPVVKRGTTEILYHVLAFPYKEGEVCYLEVEIHGRTGTAYWIEHRIYRLNSSMGRANTISERVPWSNSEVQEIEKVDAGEFLIRTCHNATNGVFGKSSYKPSLKVILKKLIIRYALEQEALDTFSRPTFFGPVEFADIDPITKKPTFRPGGYIALNPDPHASPILPAGLVWDAHLGENDVSKESLMRRLFDISEMSPVLFAGNLSGLAESGTALRLRLTNTLAKCARIRRKADGVARKALSLAMKLEGNPVKGLYIEWKDPLPKIPLEEAQRFQYYALTPQFAGEVGGKYLLKEHGYSEEEADDIMKDPTRNGGMGGGL